MTAVQKLLSLVALVLVLLGASGAALLGAYHHGLSVKDQAWQTRWEQRDAVDAAAALANESNERAKEQARQQSLNKAIEDGQKIIDQAVADAVAARTDLGVRIAADNLARSLSAKQAGDYSCTAAASQAATRAVMVLADVFKRADQRAGDLAADADQSRGRGVTCEQAYQALGK